MADSHDPLRWTEVFTAVLYRGIKDFGFPVVVALYLLWQGPKERETFARALEANAAAMRTLAAEVRANTKADEEIRGIARVVCPLCPLPPGPRVHRRPAPVNHQEVTP